MTKKITILIMLLLAMMTVAAHERDTLLDGTRVLFEENLGQWDSRVRYRAQLHDAALFVEDEGLTVALREHRRHHEPYTSTPPRHHAYRMNFVGTSAMPHAEKRQPGYSNYYLGSNQGQWRSHVGSFGEVHYNNLWQGIDLVLSSVSEVPKYNLIVHPGADPRQAAFLYEGTDGVSVTLSGMLRVRTSVRDVIEVQPYVYQVYGSGDEVKVESRWVVEHDKEGYRVSIKVGKYDSSRELIIDPMLVFSTYTGSTADNWGTTAAYDSHKNTYTAGLVFDIGYPVSLGAYDASYNNGVDIGIFKFDTSGSNRLFATYLGGSSVDMPHSMFVNGMDELLIFGTTGSDNFPTTAGAYQTSHAGGVLIDYESNSIRFANGSDIFVSRFSADGTTLQASTYVGGSGNDGLNYRQHFNNNIRTVMAGNDSLYYNYGDGARGEIITDDLGNVYVGSTTMSSDFPTTAQSVQPNHAPGQDGVVFKLDYNLRNMLWCTYIGGSGDDAVYSIDVDSNYNLLVCGGTNSNDFPTLPGAYQTAYGGGTADGFVSKIDRDGRMLIASTYIGSALYDQLYFVRCGTRDDVFLFGQTKATGATMIHNAGYSVTGSGMLLVRMAPDLSARRWSTVFGTPGRVNLSPTAFTADICNRVYAAGWGRDFVGYGGIEWNTAGTTGMETTPDAWQDSTDGQDFYIMCLDADASQLVYASFFGELHQTNGSYHGGGDHVDGGTSRFDRMATLYQSVCGSCGRTQNFPTTPGAWSDTNRSNNCNNAIFRFSVAEDFPVADFNAPAAGCAPYTVHFNNIGRGDAFIWNFGDGSTSYQRTPTHTFATPGTYTVTLVANLAGGCSTADTMRCTVQVLGNTNYSHTPLLTCGDAPIQIGLAPAFGATYHWSGDAVSDNSVANPWVNNSGTYILHTSVGGCTQTDTFHVQRYVLSDQWYATANSCHDSADASVSFRLGSGIDPDSITISVSPSATVTAAYPVGNRYWFDIENLQPNAVYTVSVSGYGCSYEQSVNAPNTPPPAYTKEQSAAICTDSCDGWLRITYNLSAIPEEQPKDTLIEGLCEGVFITRFDVHGCPLIDTTTIVRNHSLDSLRVWADTYNIYLGESVGLHAGLAAEPTSPVSYQWTPASDIDHPDVADPIATPSDTLACYTVNATSTDGCKAQGNVCIHCKEVICGAPAIFIPNAFTPNGDGLNDRVCISGIEEIVEFHIAIFNRWGEKVYESDDPAQCWDGTFRGHACLAGVYTYTCHIRCHADEENDIKGDITLIR